MSKTLEIAIEMGNAAFDEGNEPYEVARILRELANRYEDLGEVAPHRLRDINGNVVGKALIS